MLHKSKHVKNNTTLIKTEIINSQYNHTAVQRKTRIVTNTTKNLRTVLTTVP